MGLLKIFYLPWLILLFLSCEEVVDLQLDNAAPRTVIEGNLNDLGTTQVIRISRTLPVGTNQLSTAVTEATVTVRSSTNEEFVFTHHKDGFYQAKNFEVKSGTVYSLEVFLEGEKFVATSQMPEYVELDSLGITSEKTFNTQNYYPTFQFRDPLEEKNYYLYEVAINNSLLRFASAYDDKFNNGRYVTHKISDRNIDLQLGDSVQVIRYCVDQQVYKYWSDFESINPGAAAPGNPTSNISNNALGYFSVSTAKAYRFVTKEGMIKL
ncbi:DUF4249 domain-containing protein [Sphingobacterium bambusae]|uniref:DUF4249 domain-containing protein n=1 Tax=Sphingobacterium bambusae TaxID=662858 RepID=A0ABW6BEM5_9SPHI|nr:DUF4249 domain-containing protein [Sphingobacterium bambusae]WPL48567.1 DUF4249 domain-containing protein [Sphingobacterium bambusae]